jgi:hypothetical protein
VAGSDRSQARSGGETPTEQFLDHHLGNAVHLFLSLLAILILAAAAIATVEILIRDFPSLWRQGSEYDALHLVIQNLLLVAIATELALLFLFHRTSAAIEVLIFIIARKMVTPRNFRIGIIGRSRGPGGTCRGALLLLTGQSERDSIRTPPATSVLL